MVKKRSENQGKMNPKPRYSLFLSLTVHPGKKKLYFLKYKALSHDPNTFFSPLRGFGGKIQKKTILFIILFLVYIMDVLSLHPPHPPPISSQSEGVESIGRHGKFVSLKKRIREKAILRSPSRSLWSVLLL